MGKAPRIHIPLTVALAMIGSYLRVRVMTQIRAVSFIILYLVAFQMLVLGTTPANALRVSAGVGLFVFGLVFFLEGLMLGLMPLGQLVGVQLPQRGGLGVLIPFGVLLGTGATLAEPAIASLRAAGWTVSAWELPLLFRLLEVSPEKLVMSIGLGVGMAVAAGMVRLYFDMSVKPMIFAVVVLMLVVSAYCATEVNLASLLGLAWDAGAVTTGAVTVPLILALGIGVSRASGHRANTSEGFGIIMLASILPVLGVLGLGIILNGSTSRPVTETEFFSPAYRTQTLRLFSDENALVRHAFQRGSEAARQAYYADETVYRETVLSLAEPEARRRLLGGVSLGDWLLTRASEGERTMLSRLRAVTTAPLEPVFSVLAVQSVLALRAVVPLTALLLLVLLLFLKDRPRHTDEIALGIGMTLAGMALLTGGIRLGLAPLGDQIGRPLPRVFRSTAREEGRILLDNFDQAAVQVAYSAEGGVSRFFYLRQPPDGAARPVSYDPARYDAESGRYEHIVKRPPLFGPGLTLAGIGLVFLFAFGLGFGSTLAEPALTALGRTVEELTVGTVRTSGVVRAVSVGVGLGLVAGVARILYGLPIIWLIVPPYLLLLPLTWWSEEQFSAIAWDCGGVTTGPVTVPLVLAMGLGISDELNAVDGFGVLAMASVYPIISMLLYGLMVRARQRRGMRIAEGREAAADDKVT